MIDSLFYSSRKIRERCEKLFCGFQKKKKKKKRLQKALLFITIEINYPTVVHGLVQWNYLKFMYLVVYRNRSPQKCSFSVHFISIIFIHLKKNRRINLSVLMGNANENRKKKSLQNKYLTTNKSFLLFSYRGPACDVLSRKYGGLL